MFEVLVASGPPPAIKPTSITTSLATHGLLVALAVMATRAALQAPPVDLSETAMLLYVPKPPPPPPPEAKPQPPPANLVIAEPPPKGFQTVAAPTDIPTVIPEIDLNQRPLDPRDFTGQGVEGGVSYGVVGGTGKVDPAGPAGLGEIYEATTRDDRFEPATVISQPAPRYPAALEAVGIEGRVTVEFVIDTTGAVEARSIRVAGSTHPAFEASARTALAAARFHPARLSRRPVRQLTRQSIRFVAGR